MNSVHAPLQLAGVHLQPYNDLVRPGRVWRITKYFLRRWTPYLSPAEVWLIIGARQLSYFNRHRSWFMAYDKTLADAAGIHVDVFRRTIKQDIAAGEEAVARFIQKEEDAKYIVDGDVPKKGQTRYTVCLDDPLTPADAQELVQWLRNRAPSTVTPQTVEDVLEEALSWEAQDLRAGTLEPGADNISGLHTVVDVVRYVFPEVAEERAWLEAADALHSHIVADDHAYLDTQYFREQWLPILGPGPTLLLTYLRSFCFYNEESGELRDVVAIVSGELEEVLQTTSRTVRRWMGKIEKKAAHDTCFGPFLRQLGTEKLANQKVQTTYRVNLRTPLTKSDLSRYRATITSIQEDGRTGVADKKSATGDASRRKLDKEADRVADKKSVTEPGVTDKKSGVQEGNGQKVGYEEGGGGQKVGGSQTESRQFKYYKLLSRTLHLKGVEYLEQSTQQQQHLWHISDGRAHWSFAAVVADNSLANLLDTLGVHDPARSQICQQDLSPEEVVAWHLYAHRQRGLEQPLSYVIARAVAGDDPPKQYLSLAALSWEQWRTYATAHYLLPLLDNGLDAFEALPGFEEWGALFAGIPPNHLPFGVGEGIENIRIDLAAAEDAASLERGLEVELSENGQAAVASTDVARWRSALEELSLQMTQATFDAWLRDAQLVSREGEEWVIGVRSPEARAWLENRLQPVIRRTLKAVAEQDVQVRFKVTG